MTIDLRAGDGLLGLRDVQDAALVLTDIPSGKTQNEWDQLPDLAEFFGAAWAALRPSGALVVVVSHLDVAAKLVAFPHYRYDFVWEKSAATGFFTANERPLKSHEHVLVFYREQPTYNVQMVEGFEPIHAATRSHDGHGSNYGTVTKVTKARAGATDRYPGSLLKFASVGTTADNRTHPQQKPTTMLRWLIKAYTDTGELVVDPFAGSGSTGFAAAACGRAFVGWELRETVVADAIRQQRLF